MSLEVIQSVMLFLGGIGMFIYGMQIMSRGLLQAAGEKTRRLLQVLTDKRWMGILIGAFVTAIIQSSGATTVMVIGFVNAQLMNLSQAVGVIMGANIGTTMTAWLVSLNEWGALLKPEIFAPLLLLVGVVINMISSRDRAKEASNILIGFGLLFIGLNTMSGAVIPYADSPIFVDAFELIGNNPFLGLLVGAGVTAIMQSSSASMGILQVLALNGLVNWGSAVFIALGQNIGTCVVALISAMGADTNAKRAAVIHLEFNVLGSLIFAIGALIFFGFYPDLMLTHVTSTGLALFHTSFNLATCVILYPFAGLLVSLSKLIIKSKKEKVEHVVRLDKRLLKTPQVALDSINQEVNFMGSLALESITYSRDILLSNEHYAELEENEKKLNTFYEELTRFTEELNTRNLSRKEQLRAKHTMLALRDMEHIGDRCMEIANACQKYIDFKDFSEHSIQELNTISTECYKALKYALELRKRKDPQLLEKVKKYNEEVEKLQTYLREDRINTMLNQKKSNIANGVIMLEAVDSYERIASYAKHLAQYEAMDYNIDQSDLPDLDESAFEEVRA